MSEPTEPTVLYETRDRKAYLTLNRPDRLNALSFAMVDELHAALDDVHRDNACRVVVLTGAGRGFCSGRFSVTTATSGRGRSTRTSASPGGSAISAGPSRRRPAAPGRL